MSATRRASPASSIVQHPRALLAQRRGTLATARGGPRRPRARRRACGPRRRRSRPRRTSRRRPASAGPPAGPARPRSMAAGSAASTASTSSSVEVWPRVSRSAPLAGLLRDAHGQQHVATAAGRRPGTPSRSSTRSPRRRGGRAASHRRSPGRAGGRCRAAGVCRRRAPRAGHRDVVAEVRSPRGPAGHAGRPAAAASVGQLRTDSSTATANAADRRDVEGAAADLPLLAPTEGLRHELMLSLDDQQRPDAEGSADLVRR